MEPHPRFKTALEEMSPERGRLIRERRKKAAMQWQEYCQTANQKSLNISDSALEIFMTEPLLVAVDDPSRLVIRAVERSDNVLQFFVADQGTTGKKNDWDSGDEAVLDYLRTHSERPLLESYLDRGLLRPSEKLLLQLSLVRRPNAHQSLEFKQYRDRPELRRRGIGRATFEELSRLKDLGFTAMVGIHEDHNQSFYRDVLSTTPVQELTNTQKDEFDLWDPTFRGGTVQFL